MVDVIQGSQWQAFQPEFLQQYWQKKPLLITKAFPADFNRITPEELAGLSLQEGIESRLVIENGERPWETRFGPFTEADFQKLPPQGWSLLVQAVDRLASEVSALHRAFRFLPRWRVDDIMISYAADRGGVGPHTDQYDVFLLQAKGYRHWGIGQEPLLNPQWLPGLDMKILQQFTPSHKLRVAPGDMLYLPPGFAHEGIADGECMTYSIGFRAPHADEMLRSFARFLSEADRKERFYQDAELSLPRDPALVLAGERQALKQLLAKALESDQDFERWLGAYLSEPRSFHPAAEEPFDAKSLEAGFTADRVVLRAEGAKFLYYFGEDQQLYLAAEGECFPLSSEQLPLVQQLCGSDHWSGTSFLPLFSLAANRELLLHFWQQSYLRWDDEEEG